MQPLKIIIPGGSGQVGGILTRHLVAEGHDVVVLSRASHGGLGRTVAWDGATLGSWVREFDDADVVINLTGRSVNCRYGSANRRAIMQSRIASTRAVGRAIAGAARPPQVWLQASTATIYSHRYDAPNDEATGVLGGNEPDVPETWRFSIDVARSWEETAQEVSVPGVRQLLLRMAMVMSPDRGGTFDFLSGMARKGLAGEHGDGRQYISWLHDRDLVRAVDWLIERQDLAGAINLAAPDPVPDREFMRKLREAWGVRIGLPASRWMLEVGAFLMRTDTELILKSRRVVPGRLLESGFEFEFPHWREAVRDLVRRSRGEMKSQFGMAVAPESRCGS
jgi:hypothetical protein